MKKSTKRRKKNFRLNRNFFIFQGIVVSLLLYLSWGSWVKFTILVALEMTAYFTFIYYFLAKQANQKRKKRISGSRNVLRSTNSLRASEAYRNDYTREISELKGSRRIGRKNFNWEISNSGPEKKDVPYTQSTLNKSADTSNTLNSDINKGVSKEETKKFVPYRSPFDPIHPKEGEQKAEKDEICEIIEPDVKPSEDIMASCKEEKLEECTVRSMEEKSPCIMMECNESEDTVRLDFENTDNLYEDREADENFDLGNTEEVNNDVQPSSGLSHQEKTVILYGQIHQGEKKEIFEEKKPLLDANAEKKEVTVQPSKMVLKPEEYEPPVELLAKNEAVDYDEESDDYIEYNAHKLVETLASFGVGAKVLDVSKGPTVTRYELQPNAGVKVSKIINLADDIALNLAATGVRIEAPIPGKAAVGIEIPNKNTMSVLLRDVIESEEFQNYPSKLAFAVGKDIAGNVVVGDIAKMPHLLIAGATGSGKSVCINTLIVSILYKASPADVRLLMVDPKVVELGIYNGIPHLLIPVVTEPKKAAGALTWAVNEMTSRYRLFAENNVRDLRGYNELMKERGEETLPQIVIIIDELADLMMVAPNEVEDAICRLAQMARAAGMHLVIATQRPSVNVITGVIKANIPSRISFAVTSQIDSRTILDMAGAEKLLGRGDMLFYPLGQPKPLRIQGSFVSDKEVEHIVNHIKSLQSAEYDEEILQKIDNQNEQVKPDSSGDDELLPQAIMTVLELGQASASLIQRKFKVGYSRAARILDQMESWGVVSASDGSSKPRQILITKQEWEELNA
jgi:S-DNA-T family DNA segregation ATPase FtsK/SpoIIIE